MTLTILGRAKYMEKLSLYEISEAFSSIEEQMEDDLSLQDYLDAIKMDLIEKVDNIVMYRQSLELTADAVQSEIDRLTKLKKHYTTKADKLKNYLAYNMHKMGKDTLETEKAKLSFRSSETTEVDDVSKIPDEYIITKTTKAPDKTAIKNAIKGGIDVPGTHIEKHKNLVIK